MATSGHSSSSSSKPKRGYPRSRGRRGSSSSSSSYDHSYLCEEGIPKRASLWKKQHLEYLGIFYDESPSSTAEILAVVKKQVVDLHMEDLPEIGQKLIELTKQIFNFSFNFNDPINAEINLRKLKSEMEWMNANFESHMTDFKSQNRDLLQDRINERVFQNWVTYASEFLSYLRIFTVRYQMLETREGTFAQLLTQFTRLCLLVPESGDSLVSSLKIKGKKVSGIPDVRFPSHEKGDLKTVKVVTMAEAPNTFQDTLGKIEQYTLLSSMERIKEALQVKQSDALRGNTDSFHIGNLTDGVLGQHGVELLLENYKSYFRPAVSGLICIGTKLIFTVLEIDGVKYANVQADGVEEIDNKSTIMYSKPYDYMDSYDRNDILEICFWLGFVQHNAYKSVIPF